MNTNQTENIIKEGHDNRVVISASLPQGSGLPGHKWTLRVSLQEYRHGKRFGAARITESTCGGTFTNAMRRTHDLVVKASETHYIP